MRRPARLVLLSFLMLFVELALIRWTASNVIFLAYFSNFVLLGSFLGIGVGFLRAKARRNLFPYAPVALTFLIAIVLMFRVEIDRSGSDLNFTGVSQMTGLPSWLILPFIFVAVSAVMALIAEGVARTFVLFEPLEAYRYDIAGSILGIVAFSALSLTWAPSIAWGAVVAVLFAVLLRPSLRPYRVHLLPTRAGPWVVGATASLKAWPLLAVFVYAWRRQKSAAAISVGVTMLLSVAALFTDLSAYPAGTRPPNLYDATFLLAVPALLQRMHRT